VVWLLSDEYRRVWELLILCICACFSGCATRHCVFSLNSIWTPAETNLGGLNRQLFFCPYYAKRETAKGMISYFARLFTSNAHLLA